MSDRGPVTLREDGVPLAGIEQAADELIELYGGAIEETGEARRRFVLPLRRGVAAGGGVGCTLAWTAEESGEGSVTLTCDRDVDAPKAQRVMLLAAGVIGGVLFMLWPFLPSRLEVGGALAWIGGAIAIAVYFLSLRRTSGGVALDFLQRLARRLREMNAPE